MVRFSINEYIAIYILFDNNYISNIIILQKKFQLVYVVIYRNFNNALFFYVDNPFYGT